MVVGLWLWRVKHIEYLQFMASCLLVMVHGFCFIGHSSWFMKYALKFMDRDLWFNFYGKVIEYYYRPWFKVYALYLMPNALWFKVYDLRFNV